MAAAARRPAATPLATIGARSAADASSARPIETAPSIAVTVPRPATTRSRSAATSASNAASSAPPAASRASRRAAGTGAGWPPRSNSRRTRRNRPSSFSAAPRNIACPGPIRVGTDTGQSRTSAAAMPHGNTRNAPAPSVAPRADRSSVKASPCRSPACGASDATAPSSRTSVTTRHTLRARRAARPTPIASRNASPASSVSSAAPRLARSGAASSGSATANEAPARIASGTRKASPTGSSTSVPASPGGPSGTGNAAVAPPEASPATPASRSSAASGRPQPSASPLALSPRVATPARQASASRTQNATMRTRRDSVPGLRLAPRTNRRRAPDPRATRPR